MYHFEEDEKSLKEINCSNMWHTYLRFPSLDYILAYYSHSLHLN